MGVIVKSTKDKWIRKFNSLIHNYIVGLKKQQSGHARVHLGKELDTTWWGAANTIPTGYQKKLQQKVIALCKCCSKYNENVIIHQSQVPCQIA